MREQETAFFEKLDKLPAGGRTALKRSAGTMLAEADGRAIAAFYHCLPYDVEYQQERWFAAACFHCLWEPGSQPRGKLEDSFRRLIQSEESSSKSMESRIAALLDISWAEDGYLLTKLNRMIRMLKQKDYCIDCAALLGDLLRWNDDRQPVQRKWARTMYQEDNPKKQKGE